MEVFLLVSFYLDFLHFISALCCFISMNDPLWEFCVQRILCLVMAGSLQSSEPTCKLFVSLVRTRSSVSCPLARKRSFTNRLMIFAMYLLQLDFQLSDPSSFQMQLPFFHCTLHAVCYGALFPVFQNSLTPPSSSCIAHVMCWFLHSSSYISWMTCFWCT